jgi:hypothetical protein
MNALAKGSCQIAWAVVATLVGPAVRAAEAPLLVVVEAPPALDVDAGEIRRAIGAELRCQAIAPIKTPTEPPERALIVALDSERIAVSLRTGDATPVTRVIAAPADHAARLRAIAWLAGNLARDQVTPIVAERPGEPSPSPTVSPLAATSVATEPPPAPTAPSPALAPPSSPPLRADPGGVAGSIRAEPRSPPGPLRWSISGSLGPVIAGVERAQGSWWGSFGFQPSTAWQLTVERRREHERLVIGGTLEGTYNHGGNGDGPQLFGADVFVGADWRYRYCNLEATLGAGPEAANVVKQESIAYGNPTMNAPYYISVYHFDLYAQGTIAAAIPLSGSVEGLLQLGVHLSSSYAENWFAVSTIGVRYKLP